MQHSTITDFIVIYNFILLFCLGFGIPMASLNSFIFFLNQFTCETPSILKSNLPLSSCLMEQTECRVSKLRLNSVNRIVKSSLFMLKGVLSD